MVGICQINKLASKNLKHFWKFWETWALRWAKDLSILQCAKTEETLFRTQCLVQCLDMLNYLTPWSQSVNTTPKIIPSSLVKAKSERGASWQDGVQDGKLRLWCRNVWYCQCLFQTRTLSFRKGNESQNCYRTEEHLDLFLSLAHWSFGKDCGNAKSWFCFENSCMYQCLFRTGTLSFLGGGESYDALQEVDGSTT